jgi:hypothetical protein
MLRLFVRHIEAFFGQEIREISCKAILDSERTFVPLQWFKLDPRLVGIRDRHYLPALALLTFIEPSFFRHAGIIDDC